MLGVLSVDGSSVTTMFGALVVYQIDAKLQVTIKLQCDLALNLRLWLPSYISRSSTEVVVVTGELLFSIIRHNCRNIGRGTL
jgi:hypothetical protein